MNCCNEMLRCEVLAVRTYKEVLGYIPQDSKSLQIQMLLENHERRAEMLNRHVRRLDGGAPLRQKLRRTRSDLRKERKLTLSALKTEENNVKQMYERILKEEELLKETEILVRENILPQQNAHIIALDALELKGN
jgi:uncharacterized membrane protein YgaE (UPF0421/DUF939 family)